jgi:ATP-dependent Zn protease
MSKQAKLDAIKAYHEAGHAVVARALGLGVPYASILPIDEMTVAGAPHESAAWRVRDSSDLSALAQGYETDAKVMLAGPNAQHKYQSVRNTKRAWTEEWSSDIANVQSNAARIVLYRAGVKLDEGPTEATLTEQQRAEPY